MAGIGSRESFRGALQAGRREYRRRAIRGGLWSGGCGGLAGAESRRLLGKGRSREDWSGVSLMLEVIEDNEDVGRGRVGSYEK